MPPDDPKPGAHPDAFFLPLRRGRRFCIRYEPEPITARRGALVYVHPFAEEMNKSRRMAALQARAFADAGWTVLQIDLYGCGDSEGNFGEAGWRQWVEDVDAAAAWLREQTGLVPSLWGLRAGCLLVRDAALAMQPAPNMIFWQPVISGKQALQQFLRLKVAGQALASRAPDRLATPQLREQLVRGETLEIAGYELSRDLALGLEAAELAPFDASARVVWLDVAASSPPEFAPAARTRIEAWRAAGHHVDASAVCGPAFWQTLEITECVELVSATLAATAQWRT